jgi:hypothetical protein
MIVDTCIISIDWGFEEMRFDEGKIQVLQKENRNINELDVSQQKWIVVLPLSYFFDAVVSNTRCFPALVGSIHK